VSSFQLEDTEAFAPDTAVLLNLTEDHLDRHGTFAAYRAAKLEIFARQPPGAVAVVPAGLPLEDAGGAATRVTFAGAEAPPAGVGGPSPDLAYAEGVLRWRGEALMRADEIRLPGAHNRENAMAAAAACLARGVAPGAVREGLATFAGVAHRLETVATVAGVRYVNDSKATNVASAEVGLRAFAGGVHLIAGGSRKRSDYRPLAAPVPPSCAPRWRRRACRCTTAATSSTPWPPPTPPPAPGTRSCSRPPARPTTSTAHTRSAATASARS
jgi:UDP-N-acetylmuramoylalanine--D-glutamate ligase